MTRCTKVGGAFTDYKYLSDGKRFYSKASSGNTNHIYYIFSGDLLVGEVTGSSPTVAYTSGADDLISKRNLSTSTSHWYQCGPQGETRAHVDAAGNATDTYYYTAHGEEVASTGTTVNPYRYGAKFGYYTEVFTDLVLAGQRWYSPGLMRWVSRDPIGYEGGLNLYEYVGGRPVRYIDPDGLYPWRFDPDDHGGPHFQRGTDRYDAQTLEPIEHKGRRPPTLSITG